MATPAPVCIATTTVPCRLVIRATTPGRDPAWPMLVVDPCPYSDPWKPGRRHGHVHWICDTWPGGAWLRLAPCRRKPYMLTVAAA